MAVSKGPNFLHDPVGSETRPYRRLWRWNDRKAFFLGNPNFVNVSWKTLRRLKAGVKNLWGQ